MESTVNDTPPTSLLVLGTADWSQPIATNQHYVVRELCKDSALEVTFVESMGLRRPELRWRDLSRMARRLTAAFRRRSLPSAWRDVPEGLHVRSFLVIPWHSGLAASINRQILRRKLQHWSEGPGPRVLWTYTPATYGLEKSAQETVYHCVDLLGEVVGVDREVVLLGERRLADAGAVAIATSRVVADHLQQLNFRELHCWENVADTDVIEMAGPATSERHARRVIFAGNLSPQKVDFDLLKKLSRSGLDVVVAGPRAEGGGSDDHEFRELLQAGVTYLGMLKLDDLASELVRCTVGLIPYKLNDYTRGVSPLKTFEYLAAGLAVVSTDLNGVTTDACDVWREQSHESFVERVLLAAQMPDQADLRRRAATAGLHSWRGRGEQIRELVQRRVR